MAALQIKRVLALPGTPDPSTLYIVRSATTGLAEVYFTSTDGLDVRHVINKAEVEALISAAADPIARIATTEKGVANGVATLDGAGKVPSAQLPSYVDDVEEYANFAGFPVTGEEGKIYVAIDSNKTYRWSGTVYIQITSGAVDSVAGKTGTVTLVKADVGLANVDNTSDADKPISTATQAALNLKANTASLSTVATSGSYSDLTNKPTNVSTFTNDSDYQTGSDVEAAIASVAGDSHWGSVYGLYHCEDLTGLAGVGSASMSVVSGSTGTFSGSPAFNGSGTGINTANAVAVLTSTAANSISGDFDFEFMVKGSDGGSGVLVTNHYPSNNFLIKRTEVWVGGTQIFNAAGAPFFPQDTSYHAIKIVRQSGSVKLFVDGSQVGGSFTITNTLDLSSLRFGGSGGLGTERTNYQYDEIRLTGVARNFSNYTVATNNFFSTPVVINIPGNSGTTTALQTGRTINGVLFDGTQNITINAVDATARIATTEKGAANGVATLDGAGKVPATQLPSYVDDVEEYANFAALPGTGEQGKIYITLNDNKCFRWSGTVYVQITSGAVEEVNGKVGLVVLDKFDIGLDNVDNTSDVNKPVSTAQQAALDEKLDLSGGTITGDLVVNGSIELNTNLSILGEVTTDLMVNAIVDANNMFARGSEVLVEDDIGTRVAPVVEGYVPPSYIAPENRYIEAYSGVGEFPGTGTSTHLYINQTTGEMYRWNGSGYSIIADGGNLVTSVAGKTGVILLDSTDVGLGNVDNTSDANKPVSSIQQAALDLKINLTEKGAANGVATLDGAGKVPATQLPSYVDDVIEVANYAALPGTGETDKIYVTIDNSKIFRWTGAVYVEVIASPGSTDSVTEGSTNLYFTEARVRATTLTGLSLTNSADITAGDSVLVAAGKLQKQITDHEADQANPHAVTAAQVGAMSTSHAANAITGFAGTGSATTVSRSDHVHEQINLAAAEW